MLGVLVLRNCNGEACSGFEPVPGERAAVVVDLISFRGIIRSGWISLTGSGLRWLLADDGRFLGHGGKLGCLEFLARKGRIRLVLTIRLSGAIHASGFHARK